MSNSCKQMLRTFFSRFFRALIPVTLVLGLASAAEAADSARIYVSSENTGEVAAIDPDSGQVLNRIPVGKRPRGIKLSPDGKLVYVALSGSPNAPPGVDESKLPPPDRTADGIGVVDLATGKLARTLHSGQDPEAFDLSPDGKTLYVSNEETAEITVLDAGQDKIIKKVPVGKEPEGVTVRPDGKVVYVACEGDSEVDAVDTKTLKVLSHMHTDARPRSMVFTRDGKTAFAAAERGGAVTILDGVAHKVLGSIKIPSANESAGPARPMGTALTPDGKYVLVTTGRDGSLAVIEAAQHTLAKMIPGVGARPWGVGVSPDGKTAYTANGPSTDVSVIDIEASKVVRRIKVDGQPWGLAVGSR